MTDTTDTPIPQLHIGLLIHLANQFKYQLISKYFSSADITAAQFKVLISIYKGFNSPVEVSKNLLMDAGAMSRMLERMVKRDLIVRNTNSQDKRQVILALTEKGQQICERFQNEALASILSSLTCRQTPEESLLLATFMQVLDTTIANVALLPIFAHDVLHTGPLGLGLLRSAPAVGARLVGFWLSHRSLTRNVGMIMFMSVSGFGVATLIFAFSNLMWLSLLALFALGGCDMVSMVIRGSLVQLDTPDEMRGRVNAVNSIFINTSNQLGEFESGMLAAWLGAVPAAALGGIGTLLVVALWMKMFPGLRHRQRLESSAA